LVFPRGNKGNSKERLEWPLEGRERNQLLFDGRIQDGIRANATSLGIDLKEGTYCWLKGPTYETASEIEMLRRLGADAVGMSTVPETLAAKQLSMRVAGISLISNMATGITGEKLSHQEVTDTANRVKKSFTELMQNILLNLPV
jgi:purine-nucleoside phosphorylase